MKTGSSVNSIKRPTFLLFVLTAATILSATQATQAVQQTNITKRSWVDLSRYSGKTGSIPITQADYKQLVFELQDHRSARAPNTLSIQQCQPYEQLTTPRNNLREQVPLSLIHWDRVVQQITPEQAREASATGIVPAPCATNLSVFAFSPVRPETYQGSNIVLSIDQNDTFEETVLPAKKIRSLRIDPGDGKGWQKIGNEDSATASYTSTGTKLLSIEATLADGSIARASASLVVEALFTPQPTETVHLAGGTIYIYKSDDHAGLRCPVFVVEGFDMDNDMGWEKLYTLLNRQQLAETLKLFGRDLVVLDFTDAMADIMWANAYVAMDAINYINSNRSNMNDKFTVIGASMGGLVSRFALTLMDKYPDYYGQSHLSTWISFDSPQEGANIPISLQQFFEFFGYVSKQNSSYSPLAIAEDYRKKVDSPAAQQMLMCHHLSTAALAAPSPSYSSFYSDMRYYGYPSTCKKIAISNGSRYGWKQPFTPGEQVLKWYYRNYFEVDIDASIYALKKATNTAATVFYGRFNPFDLFFNSTDYKANVSKYYPYELDGAAGGTRASFDELYTNLPSAFVQTGSYCNYSSHCFIPATSALGIQKQYVESAIKYSPSVTALSPFNEFHCAFLNEEHIDINANNKRWFMRAILEDYDSDGDGYDDYEEYLVGTDYNSADSKLEGATIQSLLEDTGFISLSWAGRPNVSYKIYFTETLARDWTLVETVNSYQNSPFTASCQLPRSTQTGFYKIVTEVRDPVTD